MRTQRLRDTALHAKAPAPAQAVDKHITGQVRVLTCGSVDDGKSTLIGRLLWDASDLFEDQREALRKSTRRVLDGTHLDYSLLVDGLLAEREQGITIDIAWRYFDSANRRFVIIDSPGHAQYTRNMASGASHADVAIMLIDARHGIKTQTRRHAALLDLFGVRRVILVGICSGADNGLLAAYHDPRVIGAALIDGYNGPSWRYALFFYRHRYFSPRSWARER